MKRIIKNALRHLGYKLVPEHAITVDVRQLKNILNLYKAIERVGGVEGDIVECGVGLGRSLTYLAYLSKQSGTERMIEGFDSFEGFPEPSISDVSERNPKKGDWSFRSVDDIYNVLKTAGLGREWVESHVCLSKGFFNESLKGYSGRPIAILHADVDLYDSYCQVLDALYPYVVPGGIVLFDEYNESKWPGATKAIDEFIARTGNTLLRDEFSGKYYVVKR